MFHVTDLVGGDQENTLFSERRSHQTSKLTLRRNIEAVRRLVQQQQLRLCGQSEGKEELLLLAVGIRGYLLVWRQFELAHVAFEELCVESGIERRVESAVGIRDHSGKIELLRKIEDLRQRLGQSESRVAAERGAAPRVGREQPGDDLEQGRLAGSIPAEKPIDVPGVDVQVQVLEEPLATITEGEVVDLYHGDLLETERYTKWALVI